MKKTVAAALLLALAFTLCACGSAAPAAPSIGDQMYEKYGSIIDKLEAGEYEKVIEEVTGMMPVPENKVVTITKDNFADFYELAYDVNQINKDSAGNVLSMWYSGSSFYYNLKEEYRDKLVSDRLIYYPVDLREPCLVHSAVSGPDDLERSLGRCNKGYHCGNPH